jgi:hypothetical protein
LPVYCQLFPVKTGMSEVVITGILSVVSSENRHIGGSDCRYIVCCFQWKRAYRRQWLPVYCLLFPVKTGISEAVIAGTLSVVSSENGHIGGSDCRDIVSCFQWIRAYRRQLLPVHCPLQKMIAQILVDVILGHCNNWML